MTTACVIIACAAILVAIGVYWTIYDVACAVVRYVRVRRRHERMQDRTTTNGGGS